MTTAKFGDSADDLEYIVRFLYSGTHLFSKKFSAPFTLTLEDFAAATPFAIQDTIYYCVDHSINPNGYDSAKLTAFLAYHLWKSSQGKFDSAPMFYAYMYMLQRRYRHDGLTKDYLEKGIPNLYKLCQNLHVFLRNLNNPVPSYAFVKGVQQALRASCPLPI